MGIQAVAWLLWFEGSGPFFYNLTGTPWAAMISLVSRMV